MVRKNCKNSGATVPTMRLTDDLAGGDVERCKERGRAVARIVVRAPLGDAGGQRQQRLCAIERLDLALLVHAQHHRLHRRVEVQADDVAHLLDEQRIAGKLERLLPMRLQTERAPDARDRRLRQARLACHAARAPVRRTCGHALQSLGDHRIDARVIDRARRSRPRRIQQTVDSMLHKAGPPLGHRLWRDPLTRCDHLVVCAIGTAQDNACSQRERLPGLAAQCQRLELLPFGLAQNQLRLGSSAHRGLAVCTRYTTDSSEAH